MPLTGIGCLSPRDGGVPTMLEAFIINRRRKCCFFFKFLVKKYSGVLFITPLPPLFILSHLYLSLLSHPSVRLVCALQKNKITTKKKATSTAHYILPDTSLLGYRWERIQTNACRARNSQSTIYCSTHTRVTLIQYHIPSHPIYHIMYHTIYHTI